MTPRSRLHRFILFGAVYGVQGAMLTYFSVLSVLYFRSSDLSYTRIGVVGGITPTLFVLKAFIGLISDRVNLLGVGAEMRSRVV